METLQKTPGMMGHPGLLPLGIPAIDKVLGGGLMRGASATQARNCFVSACAASCMVSRKYTCSRSAQTLDSQFAED